MKTFKKILEIIGDVLVGIVFVISLCVIIMNASQKEEDGCSHLFNYTFFTVESDSMEPTFSEGDLIVGKLVKEDTQLKVGDIVSFTEYKGAAVGTVINTHRIDHINYQNEIELIYTKGDNVNITDCDQYAKLHEDILSKYEFKIDGLGNVFTFLKKPVGFVSCIILPILLIIGVQVYKIIVIFLDEKNKEMVEQASGATSDEVKDAIIKEYLAKQAKEQEENKDDK